MLCFTCVHEAKMHALVFVSYVWPDVPGGRYTPAAEVPLETKYEFPASKQRVRGVHTACGPSSAAGTARGLMRARAALPRALQRCLPLLTAPPSAARAL